MLKRLLYIFIPLFVLACTKTVVEKGDAGKQYDIAGDLHDSDTGESDSDGQIDSNDVVDTYSNDKQDGVSDSLDTTEGYDAVPFDAPVVKDTCAQIPEDLKPGLYKEHGIYVLVLKGTPYEMGRQHARFTKDMLMEGIEYLKHSTMGLLIKVAKNTGMDKKAMEWSYPEVIQECQGMSDETDGKWSVETCVGLAYGDVILDAIRGAKPESSGVGCSEFVVRGKATADGRVIHGRNLDWEKISYMMKYPTIIVRIPDNGIPNATVGFPGNVAPYTGINACGLSVGMDEAYSPKDVRRDGRSHNQMLRVILETCHNLDEMESFVRSQQQASAEIYIAADKNGGRVFEMTATHMAVRKMKDDVVFATNHFVDPQMKPLDEKIHDDSSTMKRYRRLEQLLLPDGKDTLYGHITLQLAADVLRDRHDPDTGELYSTDVFDNDGSLATNGNIYSMVFDNRNVVLYLAHGDNMPVPNNPYYGFSLSCLLKESDCKTPDPDVLPVKQ